MILQVFSILAHGLQFPHIEFNKQIVTPPIPMSHHHHLRLKEKEKMKKTLLTIVLSMFLATSFVSTGDICNVVVLASTFKICDGFWPAIFPAKIRITIKSGSILLYILKLLLSSLSVPAVSIILFWVKSEVSWWSMVFKTIQIRQLPFLFHGQLFPGSVQHPLRWT